MMRVVPWKLSVSALSAVLLSWMVGTLVCAPLHAQQERKDIVYTSGPHGPLKGDLYEPVGAGTFPAIIYLHGGSWRSGSKKDFSKLATDLAAEGYVGFSVDYDLQPHSFPVSWQEAEAAVRFVRAHAAEYKVDPHQIVIAGTSAGGELAALIALAPDGPATPVAGVGGADNTPATVSAAVILNGVFVLDGGHVISRYIGGDCSAMAAACSDASPMQHVHAGAPPFFVGHGTADKTVPYESAQAFIASLRGANVSVTPFVAEGGPHSYWEKSEFYQANLAALEKFLTGVLHDAKGAK